MESILCPLGTAATTGILYLPRVIVRMEKLVEWMVLAGKTEVLGENLPRRHFVHHKSDLPDPDANPGRRCGKPATLTASAMARPLTTKPSASFSLNLHICTQPHIVCYMQVRYSEGLL
jgi:hypothetical protein